MALESEGICIPAGKNGNQKHPGKNQGQKDENKCQKAQTISWPTNSLPL